MASLTAARRKKLKKDQFALPNERAYPVDTPGRAKNAKARASQQLDKGNLSQAEYNKIVAKANRILGRHKQS